MPRDLRPLLLSAALLFASPVGTALAGDDTARIGTATGVTFSGYTKDAEGRRLWSLTADKASPLTGPGAGKNDWTLERVRIRTFDKTGASSLTIAAPNARYRDDAKTASDPGPVSAESDGAKLAGRDWSWVNGADKADTITINSEVRAVLTPAPNRAVAGDKTAQAVITSKRLVARTDAAGMLLTFEGEVRLVRDAAVLTCDKLTTRVRGSGGSGIGAGLGAKPGRDDVERIDAEGSVRIINSGMSITGRTAAVLPDKNLYSVAGDAEFRDFSNNRIRVNGETMRYDRLAGRIKVDPKADSPDGRVSAELPCLDESRAKDPAQAELRARVSARDLEIRIGAHSNTLLLTGDVRLIDPDYIGSCEKLAVEAARRSAVNNGFISLETKGEPVKSVIAEDSVVLTRDGRTLRCGRAEMFPKKNLTVLTLSPRAEDPMKGATLEAARMTLDSTDKLAQKLTAESAPGTPVKVSLPSLKKTAPTNKDSAAAPTGKTLVESGLLVMTRRGDVGVFEFEDKVRIAGTGLDGSCDRLGLEVDTRAGRRGDSPEQRIRHAVAVGSVKLRQDAYAAESARAEIYPNARLKELAVADDNGMDGKEPFFVSLSRDETVNPGLRPKVTFPAVSLPALDSATPDKTQTPDTTPTAKKAPLTTVEADYQELVHGADRLRAFARGDVRLEGRSLSGRSASAELLATAKAAKTGDKPVFSADTLVARGGVDVKFGEYHAKASTLEIFPAKNRLVLSGNPTVDNMVATPGVERKTLDWIREDGPDGKPVTRLHIANEARAGFPTQITRPRILLPMDGAPDLGRTLKSLDKRE